MRRLWTVLLAVLLASTPASPASAAAPPRRPDGDAFYTPPSPLPAGADGDVGWWRPLPDSAGAKGYLVLYRSRSATDTPIAVSGRVLVPTAPWTGAGPRPIVSVASGTRGVGGRCGAAKVQPEYGEPRVVGA